MLTLFGLTTGTGGAGWRANKRGRLVWDSCEDMVQACEQAWHWPIGTRDWA